MLGVSDEEATVNQTPNPFVGGAYAERDNAPVQKGSGHVRLDLFYVTVIWA